MDEQISLTVATPLGTALDVEADSVQVPSVSGELGVLPGHVPLLAALKPGVLAYRIGGKLDRAAVGGGYVEVQPRAVRLIAEFFQRTEDLDVAVARKDLEAAEARLKAHDGPITDAEHTEAQRDLDWALARIDLAGGESG
jgi:F-type H+-transporting ATPase subunit epsilon